MVSWYVTCVKYNATAGLIGKWNFQTLLEAIVQGAVLLGLARILAAFIAYGPLNFFGTKPISVLAHVLEHLDL